MNKRDIKKCVSEIIDSLCDRNGFDDWWYNLEDSIEKEIEMELEEIIKRRTIKSEKYEKLETMNQTLQYLHLCGFNISENKYNEENFSPYKEITHPDSDKVFHYTPEHVQDLNGPYGTVDMLPIVKEEVEKIFGFELPTMEELPNKIQ
jgi:hypothetical protein